MSGMTSRFRPYDIGLYLLTSLLLAVACPAMARPGTPNAVSSWSPAPGVIAIKWQNTANEGDIVFDIEGQQDASVANWRPENGVGMGSMVTYYFTKLPAGRHCFRLWSRVGVQGERSSVPSDFTCTVVTAAAAAGPSKVAPPPVTGNGQGVGLLGVLRGGAPRLSSVTVRFHGNGDGKDRDTEVDLGVSDGRRNQIAYAHIGRSPGIANLFPANGDSPSYTLAINTPLTRAQLQSGFFNIQIEPVGHDTWNYTAYLTFTFSDGSSMLGYLRDSVSETNTHHTTPLTQFFQH